MQHCTSSCDHSCQAGLTCSLNIPNGGLAVIFCCKCHSPGLQLPLQGSILPQLSHVHVERLQGRQAVSDSRGVKSAAGRHTRSSVRQQRAADHQADGPCKHRRHAFVQRGSRRSYRIIDEKRLHWPTSRGSRVEIGFRAEEVCCSTQFVHSHGNIRG